MVHFGNGMDYWNANGGTRNIPIKIQRLDIIGQCESIANFIFYSIHHFSSIYMIIATQYLGISSKIFAYIVICLSHI